MASSQSDGVRARNRPKPPETCKRLVPGIFRKIRQNKSGRVRPATFRRASGSFRSASLVLDASSRRVLAPHLIRNGGNRPSQTSMFSLLERSRRGDRDGIRQTLSALETTVGRKIDRIWRLAGYSNQNDRQLKRGSSVAIQRAAAKRKLQSYSSLVKFENLLPFTSSVNLLSASIRPDSHGAALRWSYPEKPWSVYLTRIGSPASPASPAAPLATLPGSIIVMKCPLMAPPEYESI